MTDPGSLEDRKTATIPVQAKGTLSLVGCDGIVKYESTACHQGNTTGESAGAFDAVPENRLNPQQVTALLHATTSRSDVIVAVVDTQFRFIFFNAAYREEIRRLAGKDVALGMSIVDLFDHMPEQQKVVAGEWGRVLRGESVNQTLEFGDAARYRRMYSISHTPLRDDRGNVTGAAEIAYDVTRQMDAERGFRKTSLYLENLISHANAPIIVWDSRFRITLFNRAFEHLTGRPADSVMGKSLDILFPAASRDASMDLIRKTFTGERWESVEIPILHVAGGTRIVLWNSATICEADGTTVLSTIAQGQDITERKIAEEKNIAALREKETLIREVHHRVKNNLQVISGLLDMTRMRTSDEATTSILTDMMMKIQTMAQIHTRLYESKQFDRINFEGQVRDQLAAMTNIYAVQARRISCEITSDPVFLPVDQAIPCALVVNEILSNSFKHAFRGRKEGTIRIAISQESGQVRIVIHDDGIGLPKDFDAGRSSSLGLKLIRTLIQHQLQGSLVIDGTEGTEVMMEFPLREPESRHDVADTRS